MDFYNDLVTQKSWQTLQELKGKLDFVLIGGWAVYLYTKALKSKDIDIIVGYDQLEKLRKNFTVSKNERLKKYEARREEVQIDVYLPHYSNLGIPIEKMDLKTVETFKLPSVVTLLKLKMLAYKQRGLSAKGQKDRLDILSLLFFADIDFKLSFSLQKLISETGKIPELNINEYLWSKKKRELLRNF